MIRATLHFTRADEYTGVRAPEDTHLANTDCGRVSKIICRGVIYFVRPACIPCSSYINRWDGIPVRRGCTAKCPADFHIAMILGRELYPKCGTIFVI